jgi:hypothetical protein
LSLRERGVKKGRGDFEGDKPLDLTFVRRSDGRVRFILYKDPQEADEEIAAYGDGSVILCTDGYSIYEDIEEKGGGRPFGRHPLRYLPHR